LWGLGGLVETKKGEPMSKSFETIVVEGKRQKKKKMLVLNRKAGSFFLLSFGL
jgi:hypothetical protein